jgi:hypothetical protein
MHAEKEYKKKAMHAHLNRIMGSGTIKVSFSL